MEENVVDANPRHLIKEKTQTLYRVKYIWVAVFHKPIIKYNRVYHFILFLFFSSFNLVDNPYTTWSLFSFNIKYLSILFIYLLLQVFLSFLPTRRIKNRLKEMLSSEINNTRKIVEKKTKQNKTIIWQNTLEIK